MRRDIGALHGVFDLLVVGGGIYGSCIARAAARAGWSVALLERADFGGGVSHNSLKIIHGGFRYLQHLDIARIRESVVAQRSWLQAAPHLARPMRCVVPAYGYGTRGPVALAAGAAAFHAFAADRNRGVEKSSRLPRSGLFSRRGLLSRYPELDRADLTGGVYWYDAQMQDAGRLVMECLQDAVNHGAVVANHAEALALLAGQRRVEGVAAKDRLSGRSFEVRARVTINATGPWVEGLVKGTSGREWRPLAWTRNLNLVTRRVLSTTDAVAVASKRRSDASIGRSNRLFFITPWQDRSIIGTSHERHAGDAAELADGAAGDAAAFLEEVSAALPGIGLNTGDVCYVHCGLTPAEDDITHAKRSVVIDHASDGACGVLSVVGVKYTTAPVVAHRALGAAARILRTAAPDFTAGVRLPGVAGVDASLGQQAAPDEEDAVWAARVYGANAEKLFGASPRGQLSANEHTFRCRVLYGLENEMVLRLRDALFRATDLAERGRLTEGLLAWSADALAERLGWDAVRKQEEIESVRSSLHGSVFVQPARYGGGGRT